MRRFPAPVTWRPTAVVAGHHITGSGYDALACG